MEGNKDISLIKAIEQISRYADESIPRLKEGNPAEIEKIGKLLKEQLQILASATVDFEKPKKNASLAGKDEEIKLDIGGTIFTTKRSIITKDRDSLFYSLFLNQRVKPNANGNLALIVCIKDLILRL